MKENKMLYVCVVSQEYADETDFGEIAEFVKKSL